MISAFQSFWEFFNIFCFLCKFLSFYAKAMKLCGLNESLEVITSSFSGKEPLTIFPYFSGFGMVQRSLVRRCKFKMFSVWNIAESKLRKSPAIYKPYFL